MFKPLIHNESSEAAAQLRTSIARTKSSVESLQTARAQVIELEEAERKKEEFTLEVRTLEARLAAAREELDVQEAKIQQIEAQKQIQSDVSRQLLRTENRLKAESAKLENLNRFKAFLAIKGERPFDFV